MSHPEFRPDIWDPDLAASLKDTRVSVFDGRWLVPGEPRCLLINQSQLYDRKDEILGRYWEDYGLDSLFGAWDYYDPVLFAQGAGMIIEHIRDHFLLPARQRAIVQAHEWMSARLNPALADSRARDWNRLHDACHDARPLACR